MGLETWIIKGGPVDSGTVATSNLISSIAEIGYTGTLTAASGGTPAFITVTNKTSKLQDLEKLVNLVRAANAGIVYTQGS